MLTLQSIILTQFKNYQHRRFDFTQNIAAITGPNGSGKTNLLDVIHYLCFTKSYFTAIDSANIQYQQKGFRVDGTMNFHNQPVTITVVLRENGKKEVACNGVTYEKFSQHIGLYPCVMIAPDDTELITGSSELRRKLIDMLLSQLDTGYLQQLINYSKVLQQRNSYLKQCAHTQTRNNELLDVLDKQLTVAGNYIFERRKNFLPGFNKTVAAFYKTISGNAENVQLQYKSQLLYQTFDELLQQTREKDYLLQRTGAGVHKDDLLLKLNNDVFRTAASQGQRKSLLFGLKLAEAETLKQQKGFAPLLLLDDVFEKLDAHRMHNLLNYVCTKLGSQVFLTDTHAERVKEIFGKLGMTVQVIEL
jgi:DNA replication and repair protein RecF